MSLAVEALFIFGPFVLCLIVGAYLTIQGRPLIAGLAIVAISILPLVLIPPARDSEAPGSGIPTAVMLMAGVVVIGLGLLDKLVQAFHNRRS